MDEQTVGVVAVPHRQWDQPEASISGSNVWGTWEELLLASAVKRHGIDNWGLVSSELQARARAHSVSPSYFTSEACRSKYYAIKGRYGSQDDGDMPWFEELRKLRVADLKRELEHYDGSIGSLQIKLKRLKAEWTQGMCAGAKQLGKTSIPLDACSQGVPDASSDKRPRLAGDAGSLEVVALRPCSSQYYYGPATAQAQGLEEAHSIPEDPAFQDSLSGAAEGECVQNLEPKDWCGGTMDKSERAPTTSRRDNIPLQGTREGAKNPTRLQDPQACTFIERKKRPQDVEWVAGHDRRKVEQAPDRKEVEILVLDDEQSDPKEALGRTELRQSATVQDAHPVCRSIDCSAKVENALVMQPEAPIPGRCTEGGVPKSDRTASLRAEAKLLGKEVDGGDMDKSAELPSGNSDTDVCLTTTSFLQSNELCKPSLVKITGTAADDEEACNGAVSGSEKSLQFEIGTEAMLVDNSGSKSEIVPSHDVDTVSFHHLNQGKSEGDSPTKAGRKLESSQGEERSEVQLAVSKGRTIERVGMPNSCLEAIGKERMHTHKTEVASCFDASAQLVGLGTVKDCQGSDAGTGQSKIGETFQTFPDAGGGNVVKPEYQLPESEREEDMQDARVIEGSVEGTLQNDDSKGASEGLSQWKVIECRQNLPVESADSTELGETSSTPESGALHFAQGSCEAQVLKLESGLEVNEKEIKGGSQPLRFKEKKRTRRSEDSDFLEMSGESVEVANNKAALTKREAMGRSVVSAGQGRRRKLKKSITKDFGADCKDESGATDSAKPVNTSVRTESLAMSHDGSGSRHDQDKNCDDNVEGWQQTGRYSGDSQVEKSEVDSIADGNEDISPMSRRNRRDTKVAGKLLPLLESLRTICAHKCAPLFKHRQESQEESRYDHVIRTHVDLSMIRAKLEEGSYSGSVQFFRDLLLMINNSLVYYPRESQECGAAIGLRECIMKEMTNIFRTEALLKQEGPSTRKREPRKKSTEGSKAGPSPPGLHGKRKGTTKKSRNELPFSDLVELSGRPTTADTSIDTPVKTGHKSLGDAEEGGNDINKVQDSVAGGILKEELRALKIGSSNSSRRSDPKELLCNDATSDSFEESKGRDEMTDSSDSRRILKAHVKVVHRINSKATAKMDERENFKVMAKAVERDANKEVENKLPKYPILQQPLISEKPIKRGVGRPPKHSQQTNSQKAKQLEGATNSKKRFRRG